MRKRLFSVLLCLCMALTLLPVSAIAAGETYSIATGALTINSGNLSTYDNATITGTVSNEMEQLTIDGVTVNLTIENLSVTMGGYGGNMSGITLKNNATLNLTVKGTNTLTGAYGGAGIDVPQGCTLNITAESTGTLTATGGDGYGGGAGIGAVGNQWLPDGTPTATQSVGTIQIGGGTIIASGGTSNKNGSGVMGAAGIGGSPDSKTGKISISGGMVTAAGGCSAAGIGGGYCGYVESITITGGIVTATAGDNGSAIGCGCNGKTSGLSCGTIAINGGTVAANGNIGYGKKLGGLFYSGGEVSVGSGAGVTIENGAILPAVEGATTSTYPLSITIYDGRLTSTITNASFTFGGKSYVSSIDVSENYVGTLSCSLVVVDGTLTGTQTAAVSGGGCSWENISCTENAGSYSAVIGEKLYPVSLWFYDSAITADITEATVSAQRSGTPLNGDSAQGIVQFVCDQTITMQQAGAGKMIVWMTAGAETGLSVTASGLNSNDAMSKSGQIVKASTDGTTIIMHDTGDTKQISGSLDLSYGNITFKENAGKLDITYTSASGESSTTVLGQHYQNEYEIIQSNTTATTNQITFQNTTDFVKVKLNGVNMSSPGKAIDLQAAKAQLNLSGSNTIDCGGENSNNIGIHAAEGSALTIDGSGSLEITSPSDYGVGIGGYYKYAFDMGQRINEGAGTIRIEGGTITVSGKKGAGIGSCYNYYGNNPGSIEIAGGTVTATSDTGAAIGGGAGESDGSKNYNAKCPAITISGGTVTANRIGTGTNVTGGSIAVTDGSIAVTGGTISTTDGGKPTNMATTNGSGEPVYYTNANVNAIYGATAAVTNASVTDYTYGFNDVKTDASGCLHLFLPVSAQNAETTADFNGITYDGTISSTEPNTLKKYVPLTVSKGTVTNTGATLNVTANSGNAIYYAASATALSDGSAVESVDGVQSLPASGGAQTITLSGLTEGTAYTYYLAAKEGDDYSDVAAVTFTTPFTALNTSDVLVDYAGELVKAASGLGYTLEYALSADAQTWTEVPTTGVGLTEVLDGHTGTGGISLYVRKFSGTAHSAAMEVTIPARTECSVSTPSINYPNGTVVLPSSVQYQFATSAPVSWNSAATGTGGAVSLIGKILPAGTTEENLYKVYFRNPATNSTFASKTASVTIPARPAALAVPSPASVAETSITLAAVTGAEYSKDGTIWQDSTTFSGLAENTSHTFYQRVKATGSSFASLSSSAAITTAKNSIAAAAVTLSDCDSFIYDGTEKTPTVTVTLNGTPLNSSQYTVSYSNSNGGAGNHTNAGTVTVTVIALSGGDYSGTVSQTTGMTYTIAPVPLTVTGATATSKRYDGTTSVSVTAVALSGIVNPDDVRVDTSSLTGALAAADFGTYDSVTLPPMALTGTTAGNYSLTQPTAAVPTSASISQADALNLTGNATMVKGRANYTVELDLTQISGYPAFPGGTPFFTVASGEPYNGLTSAAVNASGKLTLVADNTNNSTQDIITISITGMDNYADSTITVAVNYTDKVPVTISGVTVQNGIYNGAAHTGYTGTPTSSYTGTYEVTYSGLNGTSYNSNTAPVNAGDYTVTFKVPDSDLAYFGLADISFTISKATITATADSKSITTGGTLPSFTVSYTGIAAGDTADSIFSTKATASSTADGKTAGSYPITVTAPVLTTVAANNYTVGASVDGTLTVSSPSYNNGGGDGGSAGGGSSSSSTDMVPISSGTDKISAPVSVSGGTATVSITDAQAKAVASDAKTSGTIKLDVSEKKADSVVVPSKLVSAADGAALEVALPTGTVTLDQNALAAVDGKGDVKLSVETVDNSKLTDTQKSVLGNQTDTAFVVDVNVYAGGSRTSTFGEGKITVAVPYTLKPGENADSITVWFINDDGTIEPKTASYANGKVTFTTEHLSQYLIVNFPFTDVADNAWCYGSVAYAYDNGLFSGTSATTFSPNATTNRQMIWMVLARMDGKTPTSMAEAKAWAVESGISDGSNPTATVTRQQMAAILYRYAQYKGYDTTQGGMAIREFSDYDSISTYAQPALGWAVNAGLVQGRNNQVMPWGSATRAQVAAILHRFSQNVVK
ncbi:putative surface layer protein [Oscillibacter valericigenes Sjm18-20]|nr:putative surface layer protein [Oscillibacter valericigenes Sjm18-20]